MTDMSPDEIADEIERLDWKRSGLLLTAIRHQQEALRAISEVQLIAASIDCLKSGHLDSCMREIDVPS